MAPDMFAMVDGFLVTSRDTPEARRHRFRGCAQRRSGGPVFYVFQTPEWLLSSLDFMDSARAPSLGCGERCQRRGGMQRDAIWVQASALSRY